MSITVLKPEETLLAKLAGVQAGTPLAAALAVREQAVLGAEASGQVLFEDADLHRLSLNERLTFALVTSEVHADALLANHYRERLAAVGGVPTDHPRMQAALRHVRRLAVEPVR